VFFVIIAVIPEYEVKSVIQRASTMEMYTRKRSYKNCHIKFRSQFPTVTFPSKSTIYWMVKNYLKQVPL